MENLRLLILMLPSHCGGLVFIFLFFFYGFGGCGGGDGGCGGGMVAMVVVWFFLFVCEFGYDCGLRLKWWFRSCGCGPRGFGGCGCVATFTVTIVAERWERGEH